MEVTVKSLAELEFFAQKFLSTLNAKKDKATVIGLSGDLGSGKTAFVKVVARTLGITESVPSPTFVLAKFYELAGVEQWSRLVHVDAYRLLEPSELSALRWNDVVNDPRHLVFVEWPEQTGELFPRDALMLNFRFVDEATRAIS